MMALFDGLKIVQFMTPTHGASFADGAAHFLGELNAIHPFREGNVRTQLTFLALIADRAGHKLDLDKLDPAACARHPETHRLRFYVTAQQCWLRILGLDDKWNFCLTAVTHEL